MRNVNYKPNILAQQPISFAQLLEKRDPDNIQFKVGMFASYRFDRRFQLFVSVPMKLNYR